METQDQQTQATNGVAEPPQQLPAAVANRAPVAIGAKGVEVKTLDDLWRFSTMIAQSDLAPKDYRGKPANVAVAIQFGLELGIAPMQAMQNVAVVNGRPSIWGDLAMALVEGSGLMLDKDEHFEGTFGKDDFTAVCVTQRRGRKPYRTEFSIADAKTAGLWQKQGPWTTNPKRMLQMRARGFNLRDNFPDVLKGMMLAEEVIDIPVDTGEPAADPVRTNALIERLNAARGQGAEDARPAQQPVETAPAADPAPEAVEASDTDAPGKRDDTADASAAIHAVADLIDEATGRPGAGFATMRKITKRDDLAGLDADRLAEVWAAMKIELKKAHSTAAAAEKPKPAGNGSLFGEEK